MEKSSYAKNIFRRRHFGGSGFPVNRTAMALAPKTRRHGGGWKYTNTKGEINEKKGID
jgi:hypothetical protein